MIRVAKYDWGYQDYDGWHSYRPSSYGGVSVRVIVTNYSQKPVKKYTVYFKAYNGAYEIVESIHGVTSADCVLSLATQELFFKDIWCNDSIRSVYIDHIDVVYTDGTTKSCTGNYIPTQEEKQAVEQVAKREAEQAAKREAEKINRNLSQAAKAIRFTVVLLVLVSILSAIFLILFFKM